MFRFCSKLILIILFVAACDDIPRDNVLDPKNPQSHNDPVVLIEAFLNSANPYPYSRWAIQSLNALKQTYGDQIVIVEYHRDLTVNDTLTYDDPYNDTVSNNYFSLLQDKYVAADNTVPKGVPDVFANGAATRISGTSGPASVRERLNPLIGEMLTEKNYYKIDPAVDVQQEQLVISCRVAALGNRSASNVRMRVILLKELQTSEANRIAVNLTWPARVVPQIKQGDYVDLDLGSYPWDGGVSSVVFALTTEDELTVLQTTELIL